MLGIAQLVKNAVRAGGPAPDFTGAVRTCIGCRQTAARDQLVRLVRTASGSGEPEALVDLRRRMPGRGAWLHPGPDCLRLAVKRHAFGRALPGITNAGELVDQLAGLSGDGIQPLRTDIVPL
ncbi:YlxR family protein [Arthrobacter sp.]|uniref:YlxR family protein n=1 Tax=Arthrobacter sp. TaxID=1667 RepID=UPI00338F9A6C